MGVAVQRGPGFEVAGWDGERWQLVGVFPSQADAIVQAKAALVRRAAINVRVTEERFSEGDGVFKSRVVFAQQRDEIPEAAGLPPMPTRGKKQSTLTALSRFEKGRSISAPIALLAGAALVVSIVNLALLLAR
jgi:hypothetical protein